MICCWAPKGGSGTSVVAAALAVTLAREPMGALLVDLAGDQPAVLGCAQPAGPGIADWLVGGAEAPPDALGRMEVDVADGLRLLPWEQLAGRRATPGRGATLPEPAMVSLLVQLLASDNRAVVVDAGCITGDAAGVTRSFAAAAHTSIMVTRPCYLALRRAGACGVRPSGVVVVSEPWRSLSAGDVAAVVGAPVVAELPVHAAIARAVDAGVLVSRLPRQLDRLARVVV